MITLLAGIVALFYNIVIFPLLFLLLHILALFNRKIRAGITGRYQTNRLVKQLVADQEQFSHLFLFHCASMGEFEHIRPVLRAVKAAYPKSRNVVSFFSPSGYNNVKPDDTIDLTLYTPFDWWWPTWRYYQNLQPSQILVARYDLWPNQVWLAKLSGIPVLLINATLQDASGRLNPLISGFQQLIYRFVNRILAVNPTDATHYQQLASASQIAVCGDTKYDQVLYRFHQRAKKTVLPDNILKNRRVFIAGSSWPEDEQHLIPALKSMSNAYPDLLVIICPHEPTTAHIELLKAGIEPHGITLLSDISRYQDGDWIVVDRIGVLASLYAVANIAYVGGSFKQNVHNVLEPAVFGIPVLVGPVNQNSPEAQLLKDGKACFQIEGAVEIERELEKMLSDPAYLASCGQNAHAIIQSMSGATACIVKEMEYALIR